MAEENERKKVWKGGDQKRYKQRWTTKGVKNFKNIT